VRCVSAIDSNGRTIWIADAHREDRKRFVARSDEKLTAFVELESAIPDCGEFGLTVWRDFCQIRRRRADLESGERHFPAGCFASSRSRQFITNVAGKKKGRTMNPLIQFKTTLPVLITVALLYFVLLPKVQAVVPPPDGGYPGFNTVEGQNALFSLTTGTGNVAVGWASLFSDAEGSLNTAIGTGALLFNTADQNTATGAGALLFNNSGTLNTANGAFALHNNTTAGFNTAIGASALRENTTGDENTAVGTFALGSNITRIDNVASGDS
jgi:hypothetical protein